MSFFLIVLLLVFIPSTAKADPDAAIWAEIMEAEYAQPAAQTQTTQPIPVQQNSPYPASVTGERFPGSGTLTDYVNSGGRSFYTIVSRQGNIFYLIIDHNQPYNNVYFLTEIDQQALVDMETQQRPVNQPILQQVPEETAPPAPPPPANNQGGGSGLIVILLTMIVVIGAAYYFRIYKPKKEKEAAKKLMENEEQANFEEPEDDTEMFEYSYGDEPEEPEEPKKQKQAVQPDLDEFEVEDEEVEEVLEHEDGEEAFVPEDENPDLKDEKK